MSSSGRVAGLDACSEGLRTLGLGDDGIGARLRRAGVTRLAGLSGLDSLTVPIWSCVRPGSRSLATSFGKGLTDTQAQVSAVMEAFECVYAEDCASRVVRTASLNDIQEDGANVVPFQDLSRCEDADIDRDLPVRWVLGQGVRDGGAILAPLELVGLDYTDAEALANFTMASIGLGAHTDRTSAIRHAVLELVEHHTVSQVDQFPGFPDFLPRLPLEDAPVDILAAIETAGLWHARPVFRKVPSAFGTTTVLCSILRRDADGETEPGRCFGVACRAGAVPAALAALVEAAQVRTGMIVGAREDLKEHHYRRTTSGLDRFFREVSWADAEEAGTAKAALSLSEIVARIEASGMGQPAVFDLNDVDDPIKVVRVLAPGLSCEASRSRRLGHNAIDTLVNLARHLS